MVILTRTVRFTVNPSSHPSAAPSSRDPNGYAGVPAMRGLGRHYEVEVACRGEIDPVIGYLINIKEIDRAVREAVVPRIAAACCERPAAAPEEILPELLAPLNAALGGILLRLRWRLSPYYSVEMDAHPSPAPPPSPPSRPTTVLLRQKFDFCASHRLHSPALSEEENRARYGKCNNPSGHGHNYQVEPCVAIPLSPSSSASPLTLPALERLTEEVIIQRFDHKNLNVDTPEFGPGGANPSVEEIARVCHELLTAALAAHFPDATLRSVTVWETDRTSATYPG